ncbi:MAG: hypothetical protein AAB592_00925 [Patescibacteria group bacterium]
MRSRPVGTVVLYESGPSLGEKEEKSLIEYYLRNAGIDADIQFGTSDKFPDPDIQYFTSNRGQTAKWFVVTKKSEAKIAK